MFDTETGIFLALLMGIAVLGFTMAKLIATVDEIKLLLGKREREGGDHDGQA